MLLKQKTGPDTDNMYNVFHIPPGNIVFLALLPSSKQAVVTDHCNP